MCASTFLVTNALELKGILMGLKRVSSGKLSNKKIGAPILMALRCVVGLNYVYHLSAIKAQHRLESRKKRVFRNQGKLLLL